MQTKLEQWQQHGLIRAIDLHFSQFMVTLNQQENEALRLASCLVSHDTGQGHACLALDQQANKPVFSLFQHATLPSITAPPLNDWIEQLTNCRVVGVPGSNAPLILDKTRLYLARYYDYEQQLSQSLIQRTQQNQTAITAPLTESIHTLFPKQSDETNWQKIAAAICLRNLFSVISGGPGTGKTTTITKVIALLIQTYTQAPRISLCAPTGKAAARLTESIRLAKQQLSIDPAILDIIPEEAQTIHRLLGLNPKQQRFKYHADNLLHVDILIVDEASMIDLSLMANLVRALPEQARLILMGDKDQLASVEAGNVLADICHSQWQDHYSTEQQQLIQHLGEPIPDLPQQHALPIQDSIVVLKKSYRFHEQSGIGHVAKAINQGHFKTAADYLRNEQFADVMWYTHTGQTQIDQLLTLCVSQYRQYLKATNVSDAIDCFQHFRLLCATRNGPWGVTQLNALIERALTRARLIDPSQRWYKGRPIMVMENDYSVNLFNGDIAILWPDSEHPEKLRAYFLTPDNTLRKVLPNRIPQHETVFTMTIHKSQGSEFTHTAVLLPELDTPILTRELVYTAITRAKQAMSLFSIESIFNQSVRRKIQRRSGLQDKLWQ